MADGLAQAFRAFWPEARCGDGSTFGCPDGTVSFCEAFVDTTDSEELIAGCAISAEDGVSAVLCGGDL